MRSPVKAGCPALTVTYVRSQPGRGPRGPPVGFGGPQGPFAPTPAGPYGVGPARGFGRGRGPRPARDGGRGRIGPLAGRGGRTQGAPPPPPPQVKSSPYLSVAVQRGYAFIAHSRESCYRYWVDYCWKSTNLAQSQYLTHATDTCFVQSNVRPAQQGPPSTGVLHQPLFMCRLLLTVCNPLHRPLWSLGRRAIA